MTPPRAVILPAFGPSILAVAALVASVLGGCASTSTTPAAPVRPASAVLALPSPAQVALAADTGRSAVTHPGRRDVVLGGQPLGTRGPSTDRIDVWSDQRMVNGRVYGTVRWQSRSVGVRGR